MNSIQLEQAWNQLIQEVSQVPQQLGSVMTEARQKVLEQEAWGFFLVGGESIGSFEGVKPTQELLTHPETYLLTGGLRGRGFSFKEENAPKVQQQNIQQQNRNSTLIELLRNETYIVPEVGIDEQGRIVAVAPEGHELAFVSYRADPRGVNQRIRDGGTSSTRNIAGSPGELGDPEIHFYATSKMAGKPFWSTQGMPDEGGLTGGREPGSTYIDVIPGTNVDQTGRRGIEFDKMKVTESKGDTDIHLVLGGVDPKVKTVFRTGTIGTRGLGATSERYTAEMPTSPMDGYVTDRVYVIDMTVVPMSPNEFQARKLERLPQ